MRNHAPVEYRPFIVILITKDSKVPKGDPLNKIGLTFDPIDKLTGIISCDFGYVQKRVSVDNLLYVFRIPDDWPVKLGAIREKCQENKLLVEILGLTGEILFKKKKRKNKK